jgi:outer membrane protein OmpA-like peptidoglycan-associated protein
MVFRLVPSALAAILLTASLTGCLTPHVKPPPSQAILQARAARAAKPAACAAGGLEAISPLDAAFAFDDAAVTEVGQKRLAAAAQWLACNPAVEVVIKPDADSHGDAAHMNELAQHRAQAVADQLRSLGASTAVIRLLPRNGADPVTEPHLLINAIGRGW